MAVCSRLTTKTAKTKRYEYRKMGFLRFVKKCDAKDHSAQLVGITDALGDPPFGLLHRLSSLAFRLSTLELWARLRPFSDSLNALGDPQAFFSSSFCSFLPIRQFKKDVSNSATQDLIINLHNKAQLTHARINCILKDSSCETPLSKILKLTILASNASSSSTKLTQDQKGFFKACNGAECKSSHIDYVTSLCLIVAAHSCLFDYEHYSIVKKCAAKDHSAQLVWITDALGDPSFGLLHRLSALAFIIFTLNTLELWARLRPFADTQNALGNPRAFFSSSFPPFCSFLPSSVHALPQTLNA
ncbi:hypothetical protein H5410_002941 [Solanum commersonii]|uniref:Uncharacterized protein n=1 Tax=Solanum commersonii TaxID=4109 RepID=A0A9J6B3M1_SOLCO|nr:hypothetical protein H5410_002941 [Solanum commersonii]